MRMRSIAFAGLVSFALLACDRSSDHGADSAGSENLAVGNMGKRGNTGGSTSAETRDAGGALSGKGGTGGESSKPLGTGGSSHHQPAFTDAMDGSVREKDSGGARAGDQSADEDDAGTDEYGCSKSDERPYIGGHFVAAKNCFERASFACIPKDAVCDLVIVDGLMAPNGDCWTFNELCAFANFDGLVDGCSVQSLGPCSP